MRLIRLVFYIVILLIASWALLVWGIPWFLEKAPEYCSRWNQKSGICGEQTQRTLKNMSDWARTQFGFGKSPEEPATLEDAYLGLEVLSNAAREKIGKEKVDYALNKVDSSIQVTQITLEKEGFGDKIRDIPQNASKLLNEARTELEKLRNIFSATERRAEDITNAVDSTRKALDALSSVLPSASPSPVK